MLPSQGLLGTSNANEDMLTPEESKSVIVYETRPRPSRVNSHLVWVTLCTHYSIWKSLDYRQVADH